MYCELNFTGKPDGMFDALWEGWVIGSHVTPRDPNATWESVMALDCAITEAFQKIGQNTTCGRRLPTGDLALELQPGIKPVLMLNKEQYELLCARFRVCPWNVARLPTIRHYYSILLQVRRDDIKTETVTTREIGR